MAIGVMLIASTVRPAPASAEEAVATTVVRFSVAEPAGANKLKLSVHGPLPMDTSFELRGFVPNDVAVATARAWRSWTDQCPEEPRDEPTSLVVERHATRTTVGKQPPAGSSEVTILVPPIVEPWWHYCFEVSFWRRQNETQVTPSKMLELLKALRLKSTADAPTGEQILKSMEDAGLTNRCSAIFADDWDGQAACEQDRTREAVRLASESHLSSAFVKAKQLEASLRELEEAAERQGFSTAALPDVDIYLLALSLAEMPSPDSADAADTKDAVNAALQLLQPAFVSVGETPPTPITGDGIAEVKAQLAVVQQKLEDFPDHIVRTITIHMDQQQSALDREEPGLLRDKQQLDQEVTLILQKLAVLENERRTLLAASEKLVEQTLRAATAADQKRLMDAVETLIPAAGPARVLRQDLMGVRAMAAQKGIDNGLAAYKELRELIGQIEADQVVRFTNLDIERRAASVKLQSVTARLEAIERLRQSAPGIETKVAKFEDSTREFEQAIRYVFHVVRGQALTGMRTIAAAPAAPAATHVKRAAGFFSTDVGAGAVAAKMAEGRFAPITFVQMSMSFGQVDFDHGLGAITLPEGGSWLEELGWHLGQRASVSLGLSITKPTLRLENGREAGGVFGDTGPLGIMTVGYRWTEFLKTSVGTAIGTDAGSTAGYFNRMEFFPMLGVSLDFPVYRVVGGALAGAPGSNTEALEKRIEAALAKQNQQQEGGQ